MALALDNQVQYTIRAPRRIVLNPLFNLTLFMGLFFGLNFF